MCETENTGTEEILVWCKQRDCLFLQHFLPYLTPNFEVFIYVIAFIE